MSRHGHKITAAALAMAVLSTGVHPASMAFAVGAVLGSSAPDDAEFSFGRKQYGERQSLIPHRTITHYPPFWLLIAWVIRSWSATPLITPFGDLFLIGKMACFGVCAAALLHLSMDLFSPQGIPVLIPWSDRLSVGPFSTFVDGKDRWHVYTTGEPFEWAVTGAVLFACVFLVVDHQFTSSIVAAWLSWINH